jgi:hypothetical protein
MKERNENWKYSLLGGWSAWILTYFFYNIIPYTTGAIEYIVKYLTTAFFAAGLIMVIYGFITLVNRKE